MRITQKLFGTLPDGQEVYSYTMTNSSSNSVTIISYGAAITSIVIHDKNGQPVDICLGYNTLEEYINNGGYLGACIGRVGNRIGNSSFTLNGHVYNLAANDGVNHLHGGPKGFDKQLFDAEVLPGSVRFTRVSPDGEENYPGNLRVFVEYRFTEDNELKLIYTAVADANTVVNLTNHTYFNLSGEADGSILDHQMQIFASAFTENDQGCLPTGILLDVAGTPFDFRTAKTIGQDIGADDQQLTYAGGYDHNYVLDKTDDKAFDKVAVASSPKTGISMEVYTDKPGMQFYSGNFLEGQPGKSGTAYKKRSGFCLETQYFPNAMACKNFPSPILRGGEEYHFMTSYRFSN